jgi:hypothetical protein
MVNLYRLIFVPLHDLNLTHDIITGNFLHDLQTRHKPDTKLRVMIKKLQT